MTQDAAIPAALPRGPDPDRRWVKLTEAAERLGVSRKVMQARLKRDPASGWVDTSGQRARWYVYTDALPAGGGALIADLGTQVEQLSAEVTNLRARQAALEVADLRAALVRAETTNALLLEAFELQEAAAARLRQALALQSTPGHVGELVDHPPAGAASANPAGPQ